MNQRLRWVLAVITGFVVWHVVAILGLMAVSVLDSFCPPDQVVSGMCTAPWYDTAFDALVIVFAGLSAVAVVLVPPLVAPTHRWEASLAAYGIGATFAIVFAAGSSTLWAPTASALVAGATAILGARALWKRSPNRSVARPVDPQA